MLVNSTKTTLPVFRIAISYNDENGFSIISKIIQLFRWMKINIIFEPVEVAGRNYEKKMLYGIDEENLTHLKKTNLFLHTPFDYSCFDKNTQMEVEKYLDIALRNCFIKTFSNTEGRYDESEEKMFQTCFFEKNCQYIVNIDEYKEFMIEGKLKTADTDDLHNCDFYYSFGAGRSIFAINNLSEKSVVHFVYELLNYLGMFEYSRKLANFKTIDDAINSFKKEDKSNISVVNLDNVKYIKEIIWKDILTKLPNVLAETETKLEGKFQICQLVLAIKERQIKLPDEYELYQIFANDVEYYPNINFWDEIAINPIINLRKREENHIIKGL